MYQRLAYFCRETTMRFGFKDGQSLYCVVLRRVYVSKRMAAFTVLKSTGLLLTVDVMLDVNSSLV